MSAATSFHGTAFFGGEFFSAPTAVGHIPWAFRARGAPLNHVKRTRGKFQVEITAEQLIALVASRHLDDDTDRPMLDELVREFEIRYMDWERSYISDAHRERSRLIAERAQRRRAEEQAKDEWLQRRSKTMKRMH